MVKINEDVRNGISNDTMCRFTQVKLVEGGRAFSGVVIIDQRRRWIPTGNTPPGSDTRCPPLLPFANTCFGFAFHKREHKVKHEKMKAPGIGADVRERKLFFAIDSYERNKARTKGMDDD
jgi:hypothetical protein